MDESIEDVTFSSSSNPSTPTIVQTVHLLKEDIKKKLAKKDLLEIMTKTQTSINMKQNKDQSLTFILVGTKSSTENARYEIIDHYQVK
jgi:hypothetical protein